jgi:hypothetical protein
MPTMVGSGAAMVATVLVLAAMAPPASAANSIGGACTRDVDCDTGLCNVYFTVRGSRARVRFERTRQSVASTDAAHLASPPPTGLYVRVHGCSCYLVGGLHASAVLATAQTV